MKWYLSIIAWIADAIKRKAELNEDDSVDARTRRIEDKVTKIEKSSLPIAIFASGLPIYLIGLISSVYNIINTESIERQYLIYLFVGALLVSWGMIWHKERKRNIFIVAGITIGLSIIASLVSVIMP